MANIKTRYSEVTKAAKAANSAAQAAQTGTSERAREEARLFAKFRDRAKEDYRTLRTGASVPTRG